METKQKRIDKRIAIKDAMMFTLNASNAAASILAALIVDNVLDFADEEKGLKVLDEFARIRDDLLKSNFDRTQQLVGAVDADTDDDKEELSSVPF